MKAVSLKLPEDLEGELRRRAESLSLSRAAYIRLAVKGAQ
jgi:predicted transcriptional regulator